MQLTDPQGGNAVVHAGNNAQLRARLNATGTAAVAAGSATVNVSHGLERAPARVLLTPTADTQGRRYWISAKNPGTFTITLDANAAVNPITFDWHAF